MKLPKRLLSAGLRNRQHSPSVTLQSNGQVTASASYPYFSSLSGKHGSFTNCTCQCQDRTGTIGDE